MKRAFKGDAKAWGDALRSAVGRKRGGEVAGLLAECPCSADAPVPAAQLRDMCAGHELSEAAYFDCEAAQTANPSKRLRLLLCAFDAFHAYHVAPRRANPVGWDTAILVTLVQRIRKCACVPGALGTGDEDSDDDQPAGGDAQQGAVDVAGTMVRNWRKLFLTLKDLDPDHANNQSRRRGALAVLNVLVAVLMQHNNTHQVRIIIRSVDELEANAAGNPSEGVLGPCGHMGSEVIRFLYFRGRMQLYDRDALGAFESLKEAARRLPPVNDCHVEEVRWNKERVLFYWVVAALALGVAPPAEATRHVPLLHALTTALQSAIRAGSDAAFDAVMEYYAPMLKLRGVYSLLLAAVRPLCLLVRLMRVHAALARAGMDPSRVPLELLLAAENGANSSSDTTNATAAASSGVTAGGGGGSKRDRDIAAALDGASYLPAHRSERVEQTLAAHRVLHPVDELALRVAQLCGMGKVKGYVGVDARTLVLSKKEPFAKPGIAAAGYAMPAVVPAP